jgi:membrane-associated phospholipid phosphatase
MQINLNTAVAYRRVDQAAPYAVLLVSVLLLTAIDAVWCFSGHWSIAPQGLTASIAVAAGLCSLLVFPKYRRDEKMRAALVCSSLFILFSNVAEIFSYLIVSTNAPLVDRSLSEWDQMLNFDWPAVFMWTKRQPRLDAVLAVAYQSVLPQICLVVPYLALTGRHRRLAEFNGVLIVAFLATATISGFFPAAGPFKYYSGVVHADISPLTQFEPLREGTLKVIDMANAQGLISIPSFHAIMAVLVAYAMRGTRLFLPFLALNAMVILSTPTRGGHYLVDVFAGVVTVTIAIMLWNRKSLARFASIRLSNDSEVRS